MCGDVAATAAGDGRRAAVGGAVAGADVRAALGAASAPLTVREIAALTGMRRDAVGRVLRLGERSGWACRERGDGRQGIGDEWSVVMGHEETLRGPAADGRPGLAAGGTRARMKAAAPPVRGTEEEAPRRSDAQPPRRLARGELQALVLRTLRDQAPQPLGVVALARLAGGRSQGAVADACERLVKQDLIQMTFDGGRRYAARE